MILSFQALPPADPRIRGITCDRPIPLNLSPVMPRPNSRKRGRSESIQEAGL